MQFRNFITGQLITPADWQLALEVGDYYAIDGALTIYGHIEGSKDAGGKGFFWARGYSIWCPEGETGIVCICDPTRKLSKEEFEAARARGWTAE